MTTEEQGVGMPQVTRTGDRRDKDKDDKNGIAVVQTNVDGTKTNKSGRKDS